MKHGWEIRPFEKCIEKVKYTTKIATCDYSTMGAYPVVSQEEEYISGYWNNAEDVFRVSKPVVIFGDHTRVLKYVDFDFVLGADGVKILQPIDAIKAKFFLYYLIASKIPSLGYSRHYKLLKELNVPVPPIAEQEKIVAELDCLSGIIEKKKQQLKELDALAQSIFYEMFGDPIENDKGWEVQKLGDICAGKKEIKRASKHFASVDTIHYIDIASIDNIENHITGTTEYTFSEAPSRAQQVVAIGDILISLVRPNLKNIAMVQFNDDLLVASSGFCVVRANNKSDKRFIRQVLLSDRFTSYLLDRVSGANYPAVREDDIRDCKLGIPPLALQQDFASKIEAIEKQKELIKQSIQETETLFNSRMDYYFN